MAGTARADDVAWQGMEWHGRARPDLADTRAEGRQPVGVHNQPIPKAPGPANMARHRTDQPGTGVGEFPRKARHGWNSTASMAQLARHDAYTWHGWLYNLGTKVTFGTARHGTARGHPGLRNYITAIYYCKYITEDILRQMYYGRHITADLLRQTYYGRYITADTLSHMYIYIYIYCVQQKHSYLNKFPAPEALDCCVRRCPSGPIA